MSPVMPLPRSLTLTLCAPHLLGRSPAIPLCLIRRPVRSHDRRNSFEPPEKYEGLVFLAIPESLSSLCPPGVQTLLCVSA